MTNDPATAAERARLEAAYERRPVTRLYDRQNPGHLFMMHERERRVLELLSKSGCEDLSELRILDFGCGRGEWLRTLIQWGATPSKLVGIDLLYGRLVDARQVVPSSILLSRGDGTALPFKTESFDIVILSTVFSSILNVNVRQLVAREISRVVRRKGLVLWYDYRVNNPRNPDVRGVPRQEVLALFPNCTATLGSITLAPPVARLIAPRSWLLCHLLERLPLVRTHLLGIIKRA